jgi:succinate-acetate transporter protein
VSILLCYNHILFSLYCVTTPGIITPNATVGKAIFGGLVLLLAGLWEFPNGNLFGATGSSHISFRRRLLTSILNSFSIVRSILDVIGDVTDP